MTRLEDLLGRRLIVLPADAEQAGRDLYRLLREADRAPPGGLDSIELLLPGRHLADPAWEGVINRLRKAATCWRSPTLDE